MSNQLPVVYLAFANALDDHLATLKEESREIFKALRGLQKDNKIQVHREESSQVDELYEDLLAYDQDIVIFHYGGHADGSMLQLEGGRGAAGGLAKLLGRQKSLKLVFLNGCATKNQVQLLHQAGVPAVIATSVKINDTKATLFSTAFYKSLARGHSIEKAFDSASDLLETKFSGDDVFAISFNRFPVWEGTEEDEAEPAEDQEQGLEWALYTRAEAQRDIAQWRLDTAQSDWQVQLRDSRGVIRSAIDDEPLAINYRSVQRTQNAVLCTQCGTTLVSGKAEWAQPGSCPACLHEELQSGEALTVLPDQVVDFTVSGKQARRIAQQALEQQFSAGKTSSALHMQPVKKIWIPYWKFSTSVVAQYSGESSFASGFDDVIPKLEWRTSNDRLDSSVADYLVSASKASWAGATQDDWDMTQARAFDGAESAQTSLPADVSIDQAFAGLADDLDQYLQQEIVDSLGGIEQRNVQTQTRYDQLDASLVWLPHWQASAQVGDNRSMLLVNGQSGAVRFPRAQGMLPVNDEVTEFMNRRNLSMGPEPTRKTLLISVFSGVGIGIMVGLLMGLAAPPAEGARTVVSVFIGAVGVGLAALLGLNDRHFSIAKGLRIGSFGLAVSLSALGGIYIRDHGLLTPGYEQVTVLHEKRPYVAEAGSPGQTGAHARSYLYSSGVDLDACSELQNPYESELTAADIINNFAQIEGAGWDKFALSVQQEVDVQDQKPVLFAARDVLCGYAEFTKPVSLNGQACGAFSAAANNSEPGALQKASEHPDLAPVIGRVSNTVSESNQTKTLSMLALMLCKSSAAS